MNKELIVYLLQQDIHELEMLTQGFEKMDKFPDSILKLASRKAENIALNLSKLSEFGQLEYETSNYEGTTKNKEDKNYFLSGEKNGVLPIDSEELEVEVEKNIFVASENGEIESKSLESNDKENSASTDELEERNDFPENNEEVTQIAPEEHTSAEIDNKGNDNGIDTSNQEKKTSQSRDILTSMGTISDTEEHTEKRTKTLEDSLNSQRINDIRNALSLGDRFRFQRELFNNNGEVMNKTISYLNKLANYEDAEKFLQRKFNWEDDNPDAEDFLKIVRRRY